MKGEELALMLKFIDNSFSFQEVFTDVYKGKSDVRVKCRVKNKKPGDTELQSILLRMLEQ